MLGIKFIKAQPNIYLLQYAKGRVVREGLGLAFFYYAPTTSLVTVPVASTESPFIFQEVTADFQTVSIQGQVTYRVADAKKLATLMNFTLDARGQKYVSDDPQKLPQRVINVVNVLARAVSDVLKQMDEVEFIEDPNTIRQETRKILEELLNQEARIDVAARQKIESQKRTILEGSQEWDILYRKYYNEEVKKLGV